MPHRQRPFRAAAALFLVLATGASCSNAPDTDPQGRVVLSDETAAVLRHTDNGELEALVKDGRLPEGVDELPGLPATPTKRLAYLLTGLRGPDKTVSGPAVLSDDFLQSAYLQKMTVPALGSSSLPLAARGARQDLEDFLTAQFPKFIAILGGTAASDLDQETILRAVRNAVGENPHHADVTGFYAGLTNEIHEDRRALNDALKKLFTGVQGSDTRQVDAMLRRANKEVITPAAQLVGAIGSPLCQSGSDDCDEVIRDFYDGIAMALYPEIPQAALPRDLKDRCGAPAMCPPTIGSSIDDRNPDAWPKYLADHGIVPGDTIKETAAELS